MSKRSGFTLMELLLVVAILAIIAAVAAPQFFRTSSVAMTDARVMLMKANYQAVKNAVNMAVWDEMNNVNVTAATRISTFNGAAGGVDGSVKTAGSRVRRLVDRGMIMEPACFIENEVGKKLYLGVIQSPNATGQTAANPYDLVASTPIHMEQIQLFHVVVIDAAGTVLVDIDQHLRNNANQAWEQIWGLVRVGTGI